MRVTRLLEMGGTEIRVRATAAARSTYDRARATIRRPRWDREALLDALLPADDLADIRAEVAAHRWDRVHHALAGHFTRQPQRFVIAASLREQLTARIRHAHFESVSTARASADRLLRGDYDLLGFSGLRFSHDTTDSLDWHYDPVNGRRTPRRFWTTIPFLDASCGDHKVIWELNRHQHWLRLGRAYWLTGDPRYRSAALGQLASWLESNPPLIGINWASMLEVAIRCLSWIWAMHFFLEEGDADDSPWLVDLLVGLDRQLDHVENNLSTYFSPNTHLLGEATALYIAGRTLPLFRASARRERHGRRILQEEIGRQIAPDGGYREPSTHYHRYALDFYLLALAVARITSDPSAVDFSEAVARLSWAARLLADSEGRLPHIGDDDGGRVLPIVDRPLDDVRDSLAIASLLVDKSAFRSACLPEEAFWMLGHPRWDHAFEQESFHEHRNPAVRSAALRDTGYYVSRSHGHHLVLHAGRPGLGRGGHGHADALSMTLSVRGLPLVIDTGTGCYTTDPVVRERFRSSELHNTVAIDHRSQSVPSGPFRWARKATSTLHDWKTGSNFDYFEASHDGYAPLSHRRHVLVMHGDLVVVADLVSGPGRHTAQAYWHLDPCWRVAISGRHVTMCHQSTSVEMAVATGSLELFRGAAGSSEALGWHAPVYGRIEPTSALRIVVDGPTPLWMVSVFGLDQANALTGVELLPGLRRDAQGVAAIQIVRRATIDVITLTGSGSEQSRRHLPLQRTVEHATELERVTPILFQRLKQSRGRTPRASDDEAPAILATDGRAAT
jgi:hypothetical protein